MSTFTVGAVTTTFSALSTDYAEQSGALLEWTVPVWVASAAEWGALMSLVTPRDRVKITDCGDQVIVDVKGSTSPGEGTLAISGLDTHTAILLDLRGKAPIETETGQRLGTASFLITL